MKKFIKIVFLLIIGIFLMNSFAFAEMQRMKYDGKELYIDNLKCIKEFKNILFNGIQDVAVVKVNGDPLDDATGNETSSIPTAFALDRTGYVIWSSFNDKDDKFKFDVTNVKMVFPQGMACDATDKLIVTDTYNDRLLEFTISIKRDESDNKVGIKLEQTAIYGSTGINLGAFDRPWGVCYDYDGNIYVTDVNNFRIQKYNKDNSTWYSFGEGKGKGNFKFKFISDVAVDRNGNIFVCDNGNNRIVKYDANFNYLGETQGVDGAGNVLNKGYNKLDVDNYGNVYAIVSSKGMVYVLGNNLTGISESFQYTTAKSVAVCKKTNRIIIAGEMQGHIYKIGATIKNAFLSFNTIWSKTNGSEYYSNDSKINFDVTTPGGVLTIKTYRLGDLTSGVVNFFSSLFIQPPQIKKSESFGFVTSNNYTMSVLPFDQEGVKYPEGLYSCSVNIEDSIFPNMSNNEILSFKIIYDDIPPVVKNIYIFDREAVDERNGYIFIRSDARFGIQAIDEDNFSNTRGYITNNGSGIKQYQYCVGSGTNWSEWRNVSKKEAKFSLRDTDGSYGINNIVYLKCRAIDNVDNIGVEYQYEKPIHIGWEKINNFWADGVYKVSDTEIWFRGGNINKFKDNRENKNVKLKDVYPYNLYDDVMRYNGKEFEFIALDEAKILPENIIGYRSGVDPGDDGFFDYDICVPKSRFVVGLDKYVFGPLSYWDKRGTVKNYSKYTEIMKTNNGHLHDDQFSMDAALNIYDAVYPYKAFIVGTDGNIYGVDENYNVSSPLHSFGTQLTKIKIGENGLYYVLSTDKKIYRNNAVNDLVNWTQINPDTAYNSILTDCHFFSDGSGWVLGQSGIIGFYDGAVWDFSYSKVWPSNVTMNCIYMKDKDTGWIAAGGGRLFQWNHNTKIWDETIPWPDFTGNYTFVVADKNTLWIGGAVAAEFNMEISKIFEPAILLKSTIGKEYIPVKRPVGLEVVSRPNSIMLSWKPGENGEDYQIIGYNVYRGEYDNNAGLKNAGYEKLKYLPGNSLNYTDTGADKPLDPNKQYFYAVSAVYGNDGVIKGETYYSNEGFGTPKGSSWKSAGTDLYPMWNFTYRGTNQIAETFNGTKSIHDKFFAGNIYFMKYSEYSGMWENANIPHPYTTDITDVVFDSLSASATGMPYMFDVASNGKAYAADINLRDNVWEYDGSVWRLISPSSRIIMPGTSKNIIKDIRTPGESLWLSLNSMNGKAAAKNLGALGFAIFDGVDSATASGILKMKSDTYGWTTKGVLDNGSFNAFPARPSTNIVYYIAPYAGSYSSNFDLYSRVYPEKNGSVYNLFCSTDFLRSGTPQKLGYGISKWNGEKWNFQYIEPHLSSYENLSSGYSRIADFAFRSSTDGYALIRRMNSGVTEAESSAVLQYNGTGWSRSELPGDLDVYSTNIEGNNAKDFIAAEYGQILERDRVMVTVTPPLTPGVTVYSTPQPTGYVHLVWQAVLNTGSEINGYNIYRKYDNEDFIYVGTTDKNTTEFSDYRFMTVKGDYTYKITAFDRFGNESEASQALPVNIGYLYTPTSTPSVIFTQTFTPTYTATPANVAWAQYGHDTKHTFKSNYAGYAPAAPTAVTGVNVALNFYAPDNIGDIVADKSGNIYFHTTDEQQNYIFRISAAGEMDYVITRNGTNSGIGLSENGNLYYSVFDPYPSPTTGLTSYAGLHAMDAISGENRWNISNDWFSDHMQPGDGVLYAYSRSNGIRKISDNVTSATPIWSAGRALCQRMTGNNAAIDGEGNVYFTEPVSVSGCLSQSGIKVVKYNSAGDKISEVSIEQTGKTFEYENSEILIDDQNLSGNSLYVRVIDNSNKIYYVVINTALSAISKFIDTGLIYSGSSRYPLGAIGNKASARGLYYLAKYNAKNTVMFYSAGTSNPVAIGTTGTYLGTDDIYYSDMILDKNNDIYIGNETNMYKFTSLGAVKMKMDCVGNKKAAIITGNSRVYFDNNRQIIGLGNGTGISPLPTAVNAPITAWVSIVGSQLVLTWNEVPGAVSYNIYKAASPYQQINAEPVTSTSYEVSDLESGALYYFLITSVDEYERESNISNEMQVIYGTATITPTVTPTITPTPYPTTGTHKLDLKVANAQADNDCSANGSTSKEAHFDFKIVNNDSVAVNINTLKVKMWFKDTRNVEQNGFYGGELKDASGNWIANVSGYVSVNNSSPSPECSIESGRYASKTAVLIFTTDYNLPANGGYANSLDGKLYLNTWHDPFDSGCDDYSRLGTSNIYADDTHFALYENDILVTEWSNSSGYDINTGKEPCLPPTATITATFSATPTVTETIYASSTLTNTISPTSTDTPVLTETPTFTVSPTGTDTPTETITPSVTETDTETSTATVTETTTETATETNTQTVTETVTDTPFVTATPTATVTETATPYEGLSEAVDNSNLEIFTGGHAGWFKDTQEYNYDGDSAKSGIITHQQRSVMQTEVTGYAKVTFMWKVSSESAYDYLVFSVDDTVIHSISGNVNWKEEVCEISAGPHTLKWEYIKDGSVNYGEDCGWVDRVQIIQTTPTATYTITETRTETPIVTETPTSTLTATQTMTETVTETSTETNTATITETAVDTPFCTETPTATVTNTNTESATPSITQTPTVTGTATVTSTAVLDSYEPDNSYSSAKTIQPQETQVRSIAPAGDSDIAKFTLTADSNVVIETSGNLSSDTAMWLYQEISGEEINLIAFDDDNGTGRYSMIATVLEPGTYYIKVEKYGNDEDIYEYYLKLNASAVPTATPTITITGTNTGTPTGTCTMTGTPTGTATETATPSMTGTCTITVTYTQTPTETATPSITQTHTASPTVTATVCLNLNVTYRAADINDNTNSPLPQFMIINNSPNAIDINKIQVKYWYRFEGTGTETSYVNSVLRSGTHIEGDTTCTIISGSYPLQQDRYLLVSFGTQAGSLGNGAQDYLEINAQFHTDTWSSYNQINDYSFLNSSAYTANYHLTVYYDGQLVWGQEPEDSPL
jgi:hypothetical protein